MKYAIHWLMGEPFMAQVGSACGMNVCHAPESTHGETKDIALERAIAHFDELKNRSLAAVEGSAGKAYLANQILEAADAIRTAGKLHALRASGFVK